MGLLGALLVSAPTVESAPPQGFGPEHCRIAIDADFESGGREALQEYLDVLRADYGREAAPAVREVSVVISKGPPPPGLVGTTAGEVACKRGDRFRITLFRDALAGRSLMTAYNTVAHEFHHVVQIERDDLPCAAKPRELPAYEREAAAVADRLAPPCR